MVSLIIWPLYFLKPVYAGLLWPAIVFTIVAVVCYVSWKPCLKTCGKCRKLLALWGILLGSFMAFLCLSFLVLQAMWTMTPVYLGLILLLCVLITMLVIYLLYLWWVKECCPTPCEKWTALLEAMVMGLGSYATVISILAAVTAPGTVALSNVHIGWLTLSFIMGIITLWVAGKRNAACA